MYMKYDDNNYFGFIVWGPNFIYVDNIIMETYEIMNICVGRSELGEKRME